MRKLLILTFFPPMMAWAQSSLPPCAESGYKDNCFGTITNGAQVPWESTSLTGFLTFRQAR